ncbi:hypothetical protein, partial [Citrobacter koseri]|uniref:hypothetical protein n=1 Tax=Citrobacter koseri TaxID=545 RepID=UPI001E2C04B7
KARHCSHCFQYDFARTLLRAFFARVFMLSGKRACESLNIKRIFMNIKRVAGTISIVLLTACVDSEVQPAPSSASPICQGFGCVKTPGKLPSRAATHKPTKEERNRVIRGEKPDFGSEEWSVGGTLPSW